MRAARLCASVILLTSLLACGEDDEEGNPPPVGSGSSATATATVTATATATASSTATDGGSSGTGDGSSGGPSGTAGSTGQAPFTVISGRLLDGGGGYALPITCLVRFHAPGQIEPATGVDTAVAFSRPFEVDAFPQSFALESADVPGLVEPGDTGFITVQCDIDDDEFYDDNAGGFYPTLPLGQITVPASSLDIQIGDL